jgi:hypothetical protein
MACCGLRRCPRTRDHPDPRGHPYRAARARKVIVADVYEADAASVAAPAALALALGATYWLIDDRRWRRQRTQATR